ncbi:hypothetical protein RvY_11798 [Ramazzottius varieornatus]|uniref:Mpv17-like protein 2 n=1 Tax=Ramazzottius varieornatus TaxID=947166 RepID=A0A1D1VHB5_RAMVA|nr:hypothetical protein RvY_11798 [Ramazzottius varieornatus]
MSLVSVRNGIQSLFERHLFLTNISIAGTLFGVGDAIQQNIEIRVKKEKSSYDWPRTARMATTGMFVMGPLSHHWFRALDRRWPKTDGHTIAKKVATDQLVSGPPFQFAFFWSMGTLEGKSWKEVCEEYRSKFLTVFLADCALWVPMQCINFRFVSPKFRILFISCTFVVWNTFLSYFKHQEYPSRAAVLIA